MVYVAFKHISDVYRFSQMMAFWWSFWPWHKYLFSSWAEWRRNLDTESLV